MDIPFVQRLLLSKSPVRCALSVVLVSRGSRSSSILDSAHAPLECHKSYQAWLVLEKYAIEIDLIGGRRNSLRSYRRSMHLNPTTHKFLTQSRYAAKFRPKVRRCSIGVPCARIITISSRDTLL